MEKDTTMDWSLFYYNTLLSDVAERTNNIDFDEFYRLDHDKLPQIIAKIERAQPKNPAPYFLREKGIQINGEAILEDQTKKQVDIGILVSGKVINCKNTALYLVTFKQPEYPGAGEHIIRTQPNLVELLREYII